MQKTKYSMFKKMRGEILYFSTNKFQFLLCIQYLFFIQYFFVQAGRAGPSMPPFGLHAPSLQTCLVGWIKKKVHSNGLPPGRGAHGRQRHPFAPRPGAPYTCAGTRPGASGDATRRIRGRVPAHQGTRPGVPARLTRV